MCGLLKYSHKNILSENMFLFLIKTHMLIKSATDNWVINMLNCHEINVTKQMRLVLRPFFALCKTLLLIVEAK